MRSLLLPLRCWSPIAHLFMPLHVIYRAPMGKRNHIFPSRRSGTLRLHPTSPQKRLRHPYQNCSTTKLKLPQFFAQLLTKVTGRNQLYVQVTRDWYQAASPSLLSALLLLWFLLGGGLRRLLTFGSRTCGRR